MIHNDKAIEIFKKNGIKVEDNVIFPTEAQVMEWVGKAPHSFDIKARNSKYNTHIGDLVTNPSVSYGCAFVCDRDGTQRPGTKEDYVKINKLVQANDDFTICGGITAEPSDVATRTVAADMFYSTLLRSDKSILVGTSDADCLKGILEAGCAIFGREEFLNNPHMYTLINTNSPLQLEGRMLDNLMLMSEYGQPVVVCPAAMLGATGPLTREGTLAMGAAESLAGIMLTQMINPGVGAVFGVQSTAADMKTVSFACAAPEGAFMQGFGKKLAEFYGVPSRGGGSQSDAPVVNAQAGYESMLTFFSAYSNHVNIVMEAGGVLDAVNCTSFDKLMVDFEIIRLVKAATKPLECDDEHFLIDEIEEIEHSGSFLTSDYTLDNFEDLYNPHIGGRATKDPGQFEESIDDEIDNLLDEYEDKKPDNDPSMLKDVKEILNRECGVDIDQLTSWENI